MKIIEHVTAEVNDIEPAIAEINNIGQAIKEILRQVDEIALEPVWQQVTKYNDIMDKLQVDGQSLSEEQINKINSDPVFSAYDFRKDIKKSLLSRNEQILKGKKKPGLNKEQVRKKLHVMYKKEIVGTKENEGIYKIFRKLEQNMELHGKNLLNATNPIYQSKELEAMDDICRDRRLAHDFGVFSKILYKKRQRYFQEFKKSNK